MAQTTAATIVPALPKKARTPPPPKRPVQAPKVRSDPHEPRFNQKMVAILVGSAVAIAAIVAGFVLFAGGDSKAATSAAEKLRALGCTVQDLPAAPNFRLNGKQLPYRHIPNGGTVPPKGFTYNSNPPTSGIHSDATVIYGIYDQPVTTVPTVHNLEHGAIVIRYGPQVPSSEVQKLREFYPDDPNGLVIAPMPGLGSTIALAAWTYDQGRQNDRGYQGEGHLAKCTRVDVDALKAFVDAYRGRGPERFPVSSLKPGGP
jgi:hypothetical protein